MNTQSTKPKTKIELNMSNLHAVSQLSAAHKGVMTCARMGLTVVNVSLGGQIPTLEVQPSYVTASLLKNGRAVVYMHVNNQADRLSSRAQIRLSGCRVVFAVERQIAVKH